RCHGRRPARKPPRPLPRGEDDPRPDRDGGEEVVAVGHVVDEWDEPCHREEGQDPRREPSSPGEPLLPGKLPEHREGAPPGDERHEKTRVEPTHRLEGVERLGVAEREIPPEVPPRKPE